MVVLPAGPPLSVKTGITKIPAAVKGKDMGVLKSVRNKFQKKKLFKACKKGDEAQVLAMIGEQPELAASKDYRGLSPFFYAVECGNSKIAEAMLKITNQPDEVEPVKGFSPLLLAASKGYSTVVELLLKYNANPDVQSKDGITALHNAVYKGQVEIVRMLLDAGADPMIQDRLGNTAADLASQSDDAKMKELFSN